MTADRLSPQDALAAQLARNNELERENKYLKSFIIHDGEARPYSVRDLQVKYEHRGEVLDQLQRDFADCDAELRVTIAGQIKLREENERLRGHISDIVAHATPFGITGGPAMTTNSVESAKPTLPNLTCSWCRKPINHHPGEPLYFADEGWNAPLCYACWYDKFGKDVSR